MCLVSCFTQGVYVIMTNFSAPSKQSLFFPLKNICWGRQDGSSGIAMCYASLMTWVQSLKQAHAKSWVWLWELKPQQACGKVEESSQKPTGQLECQEQEIVFQKQGGKREPTSESCPLTSRHLPYQTLSNSYIHHTVIIINKNEKLLYFWFKPSR